MLDGKESKEIRQLNQLQWAFENKIKLLTK